LLTITRPRLRATKQSPKCLPIDEANGRHIEKTVASFPRHPAVVYIGSEKLELELSELQAGFLLDYFSTEIAPFAYNEGVADAQKFFGPFV
jgi:hypothetical protein